MLTMQKKSEKIIATFPEVKDVYSRFGTPQSATDPAGVFFSDTFIILEKDTSKWRRKNGKRISKDELFREMIAAIDADKSVGQQESSSTQPIEMRFNEMLEGSRADVTMRIYGTDLDKLAEMTTKGSRFSKKLKASKVCSPTRSSRYRKARYLTSN